MAEQQQPVRRKVALKVLKPGMDTRQVIVRFEAERQALALMDHPNIARVLDAGETGAGRPHFVMELVKGVPITDYCDQNRLSTGKRLELFTHVCHAVQHAHHKGIIHRDLKPSNVMVTLHDAAPVVKVIDFGIAKALGQQLTDKTLFTGFAQMVGTPLYMSPEQAQLSGLDIDTRSDIYSLGVLLYELLAGVTPFDRERMRTVGYDEMRRIVREEDLPSPSTRLSTLGEAAGTVSAERQSDPKRLCRLLRGELDWIVMKALEKDRNRRYQTTSELARDVEHYLHDEPVLACPPSAWYRFRKFMRRHKAGLLITAATALVLLLAGAGASWALRDQAARRTELSGRMAETEQTVSAALVQADQWRKQAGEAPSATSPEADAVLALWRQAEASLAQAETALKTGTAGDRLVQRVLDVRRQVAQERERAQRTANLLRDLDDARMTRSNLIENTFDLAGSATKYAAAFAAYGLEVKPGLTEELARRIRAEQPDVREALIVALDDWWDVPDLPKTGELAKLAGAIAAAADDDPWRRQYRAAAVASDTKALRELSVKARQLSLTPSSLAILAADLLHQGDHDEAAALLRWARDRHPADFWIHFRLGSLLNESKDHSPVILEEALGCFRAALALRPATAALHLNIGRCLLDRKQPDEAILCYGKAIELNPKQVDPWIQRGYLYWTLKKWDNAIADFSRAIELDPKDALAHNNLGTALEGKNRLDEAMAEYKKAIELDNRFAPAHNNLGKVLKAKNQPDEAMAEYRKAIELDPKNATAHNNLGIGLLAENHPDDAIAEHRKAIALDPKWAPAHYSLGNALRAKNQLGEAITQFRQAIELDPNDAMAHNNLGSALLDTNRQDEAMAEYRKAVDLDPKLATAHYNLGGAFKDRNKWDEAISQFQQVIELDPNHAMAHNNLGFALSAKNRPDEAMAEYRKAVDLDPKLATAHYNLGNAFKARNKWDEAIAEYKKVIDLQPDLAEAHCNLGYALRSKGELSASLDSLKRGHALGSKRKDWHYPSAQWVADAEKLVRLEAKLADVLARKATPKDQSELHGLLEVCRLKRRYVAAARLYADAFTADPKLADDLNGHHRYTAAWYAALAVAGQGTDAGKLDDQDQSRLRQQALAWLRADLEQWRKRMEGGKPEDRQVARAALEHWQHDTALAGVRDAAALEKLAAQEQESWRKLWADVGELAKAAAPRVGSRQ
jgi:tetratricopeptide (TPR) repeat protein